MSININISNNAELLGLNAAKKIAEYINNAIEQKGSARIVLSTGMSQFETLDNLVKQDIKWDKVEMFHLDEYVGITEEHKASFRKYLKERFISKVNLKRAYLVSGEGNLEKNIELLAEELRKAPIDAAVIGIGENGHIAFNDPPADFEDERAYKVVNLDQRCRMQQVHEHWFDNLESVPERAITMCPKEILKALHIVTAVPHEAKAEAIFNTLTSPVNENVPATLLKTHPDWNLFIDKNSADRLFKF